MTNPENQFTESVFSGTFLRENQSAPPEAPPFSTSEQVAKRAAAKAGKDPTQLLTLNSLARKLDAPSSLLSRVFASAGVLPDFEADRIKLYEEKRVNELRALVAAFRAGEKLAPVVATGSTQLSLVAKLAPVLTVADLERVAALDQILEAKRKEAEGWNWAAIDDAHRAARKLIASKPTTENLRAFQEVSARRDIGRDGLKSMYRAAANVAWEFCTAEVVPFARELVARVTGILDAEISAQREKEAAYDWEEWVADAERLGTVFVPPQSLIPHLENLRSNFQNTVGRIYMRELAGTSKALPPKIATMMACFGSAQPPAPPAPEPTNDGVCGAVDYAAVLAALDDGKLDSVLKSLEVQIDAGAGRAEKIAAILKKNGEVA